MGFQENHFDRKMKSKQDIHNIIEANKNDGHLVTTFEDLPIELIYKIAALIGSEDVSSLSRVNKEFNIFLNDHPTISRIHRYNEIKYMLEGNKILPRKKDHRELAITCLEILNDSVVLYSYLVCFICILRHFLCFDQPISSICSPDVLTENERIMSDEGSIIPEISMLWLFFKYLVQFYKQNSNLIDSLESEAEELHNEFSTFSSN